MKRKSKSKNSLSKLVRKGRWNKFIGILLVGFLGMASLKAQPALGNCDQEVSEKAQKQIPRARQAISSKNYREAKRYLDRALRLDSVYADALYLLGDMMVKKAELMKAEALWSRLLEVCPDYKADVYYFLGVILIEHGKQERGIELIETFLEKPERSFGYDRQAKMALEEARLRKKLKANPVDFDPKPLPQISTTEDEYLATISPDQQLLFFTRRSKKVNRKDGPAAKKRMVEEFSLAERNTNGEFGRGKPLPTPFNQNFNEGGPTITADNTELYFTVCKNVESYKNCDIYFSERGPHGWSTPRSIGDNINRRDSWESQPSISASGQQLYFASNRDGGVGGLDIYKCVRKKDASWGDPQLLSKTINTRKDEKTPFMHSDSRTLYFTSKGHAGMGGFDIYYAKAKNDTAWNEPQNIGYPINSEKDDLGLFVSLGGKRAFFASNKLSESWDIFGFELPTQAQPEEVALISGTLESGKDGNLEGASVKIKNLKTREINEVKVDEQTGNFAKVMQQPREDEDLILTVQKKGTAFSSHYVKGGDIKNSGLAKAPLKVEELQVGKEYKLNDINFETDSYALDNVARNVIDEFVNFLEENPRLKADIQGHTDNVGDDKSNLTLSKNRAQTVYDYVIEKGIAPSRLTHHGFGEKKPIATNATEAGRAQNRRTVFVITSE